MSVRSSGARRERPHRSRFAFLFCFVLSVPLATLAAQPAPSSPPSDDGEAPGAIAGRVVHADHESAHPRGEGIGLTEARLVELGRKAAVSDDGDFRFDRVPAGDYVLQIMGPGGSGAARVTVTAGATTSIEVPLQIASHFEEVVVSASGDARLALELALPTSSLSGHDLQIRTQATLGETLDTLPGVSSTAFGQGASRPVVRGQSGDRVRMLEGGVDTGDASAVSADHAVTTDPMLAERIEVLRGPSTLLYGSSAIGGAVNVVDERIPTYRAIDPVSGRIELRGGSAADERAGAVLLEGGRGNWAYHVGAAVRDQDDFDIPGFASVEPPDDEDEENPFGTVPNSDVESQSGRFGVSWFLGDRGFIGASISGFDSEYGIPGGHGHGHGGEDHDEHGEEAEEEEGPVRIDMEQRRVDLRSEISQDFGLFRGLRIRLGGTDYEHVELEGAEVGTTFLVESLDGRLELVQRQRDAWSGSVGLQFTARELEAIGEEAFIPRNESERFAIFTFQELEQGLLTWQFGVRFESQDLSASGFDDDSSDGLSASAGLVWDLSDDWSIGASVARSTKLPIAEELYSDGVHAATRAFEIGNPDLDEETSLGFDLSLRKKGGRIEGELSVFHNDFDDYIYQAFTGEEREGFPVVLYSQEDGTFRGVELNGRIELVRIGNGDLHLNVGGDWVEAEIDARDENLPRIPPLRLWTGLHYHGTRWNAMVETRWVDDADDLAPNETRTDGYTLLNASLGYRLFFGDQLVDLMLTGRNLTDEDARKHTSFLKDTVPLPGRDIGLSVRFGF